MRVERVLSSLSIVDSFVSSRRLYHRVLSAVGRLADKPGQRSPAFVASRATNRHSQIYSTVTPGILETSAARILLLPGTWAHPYPNRIRFSCLCSPFPHSRLSLLLFLEVHAPVLCTSTMHLYLTAVYNSWHSSFLLSLSLCRIKHPTF